MLCEILDCTINTGKSYGPNNYRLRKFFLTDSFIQEKLGLTLEDYKKIKTFDLEQTRIIVKEFSISYEELRIS